MYQQFGIDKSNLSIAILIKDTTISERRLLRWQVSTKGPASMDHGHHEFFQAEEKPTAKKPNFESAINVNHGFAPS